MGKRGTVPLERAFSKLGIASRTEARKWILAGKVRVNGVLRLDPGFSVRPETARIEVDGQGSLVAAMPRAFLLHKPKGVVTTRSDEKGRATVFSILAENPLIAGIHLHAVGRLDLATSGLLFLTNDTRLSSWLTDPAREIPRTYLVSVRGRVTDEKARLLEKGRSFEGEIYRAHSIEIRKASERESHLTVILTEGKNREIRKLFLSVGNEVTRLKRVAFGGMELGELEPGQLRELTLEELAQAFPDWPSELLRPRD